MPVAKHSKNLNLRIKPHDLRVIREAAQRAGKPLSWWIRETLVAAAARLIHLTDTNR
jgi:predicted HicB family RNase H-like nuclease